MKTKIFLSVMALVEAAWACVCAWHDDGPLTTLACTACLIMMVMSYMEGRDG